MAKRRTRWLYLGILTMVVIFIVSNGPSPARADLLSPTQIVQRAWRNVQDAGAYDFDTAITQVTHPGPALANVGRTSNRDTLYLSGHTDLPAETIQVSLWSEAGGEGPGSALQMRVEGDRAYGRCPSCDGWEEMDDIRGPFFPGSDLMVYLAGAKQITEQDSEVRQGIRITRYTFEVDGPSFGKYMRQQMEDQLRAKGELPPGIDLSMAEHYREMVGQGEVWIAENGLPLRLTVHLAMPAGANGDWVEGQISTDFSGFQLAPVQSARFSPLAWAERQANRLARRVGGWEQIGVTAFAMLAVAGVLLMILTYGRSKRVYATVALTMILCMVVVPSLQNHQVAAFYDRQAVRQAQQDTQKAEREQTEALRQQLFGSAWNPKQDPLTAYRSTSGAGAQSVAPVGKGFPVARTLASQQMEENPPVADPSSDEDGDGLTLAEEVFLGLNPTSDDTDSDGITDDVEVQGFDYNGQHWYLDANNPDTNNDGILDTEECPECMRADGNSLSPREGCRDTDGDGVPDVFDGDNDGDGVPDRVDLAPFDKLGSDDQPFDGDMSFNLVVDNLTPNEPTFVDIQLRPVNPDHLTYHYNVLDWPSGDTEGQIQRVLDTTWADQGASSAIGDENGDLRLIPLLEITIPYKTGHYGNLPVLPDAPAIDATQPITKWLDMSKLEPYGISASYKNEQGDLLVTVPLNVVRDQTGGGRVAYSARMLYWPDSADWGNAQQMRVVWLVQMVVDTCDQENFVPSTAAEEDSGLYNEELEAYCSASWNRIESVSVVHTYDEEWVLTGLAVREDHGMQVGVIFEDPATDQRLNQDDNLWQLAAGLGDTFLAGRKDGQGQRDLTLETIKERFDNQSNSAISEGDERLWGVPKNAMRVLTHRFEHQDYLMQIPMTTTKETLNTYFLNGSAPVSDAPLLMMAREEVYRSIGMGMGSEMVQKTTSAGASFEDGLRLVMSADATPNLTMAFLQWAPYRYTGSEWEPYPIDDYYNVLQVRLGDAMAQNEIGPDDLDLADQVQLAMAFYMSLHQGASSLVQRGVLAIEAPSVKFDSMIVPRVSNPWPSIYTMIAMKLLEPILQWAEYFEKFQKIWTPSDMGKLETIKLLFARYRDAAKVHLSTMTRSQIILRAGILLGGAAIALGLTIVASALNVKPLKVIRDVMAVVMAIYSLVKTVNAIRGAIQGVTGVMNCLKAVFDTVIKAGMKAAVVGLVIVIVMQFGMFIASVVAGGIKMASLAFTNLLAETIAATISAIVMFAIGCIPIVGQIIMAIVAIIDALIALICGLLPDDVKDNKGVAAFCRGISGWITAAIKWLIYSQTILVDFQAEGRFELGNLDQRFIDSERGTSVGNALSYSADVTNTIDMVDIPLDWKAQSYSWQYSLKNLKKSTFAYALTTSEATDDDDKLHATMDLGLDQMSDAWQDVDSNTVRLNRSVSIASVPLDTPGINRQVKLYLAEGFAVPAQECWAFPAFGTLVPVCYIRSFKDTSYIDLGESFKFDVFPATLDEFYSLTQMDPLDRDQGFRPSWDAGFPRQKDADGDGLLNKADGGADPNDSLWDSDGDGLGDLFELQKGLNPAAADEDADGLNDAQELILGTDPRRADTDGDGLLDGQEIFHQSADGAWSGGWEVTYGFDNSGNPKRTWVTSEPNWLDSDLDGITDFQERTYAYSPRAMNAPTVLNLSSEVSEMQGGVYVPTDGFVAPGQTLHYTATIKNELMAIDAQGLFHTTATSGLNASSVNPTTFILQPLQSETMDGPVSVNAGTGSGKQYLTQEAGAELINARAEAGYAEALLHLDEGAGATTFADSSGQPLHEGTGHGGLAAGVAGVYGYGVSLDGTDDYIQLEHFSIAGPITLAAWVKPQAAYGFRTIIIHSGTNAAVRLYISEGKYGVGSYNATGQSAAAECAIPAGDIGQWVHLAGVYDGSAWRLYRNGEEIASVASDLGAVSVAGSWSIGAWLSPWGTINYYQGSLDEVGIYAYGMSAPEVERLYGRPILELRLNESAGATTFLDSSGLGHTAVAPTDSARQPLAGSEGIQQNAVFFDGGDYIAVQARNDLKITEPRFSLTAWIKPANSGNGTKDGYVQSVLGRQSDSGVAYPTLQIVGQDIRAGFSASIGNTGTYRWYQYTTTSDPLTRGQWNHVVVIFDSERFQFYVNGKICENEPGLPQDSDAHQFTKDDDTVLYGQNALWVGRSNGTASVTINTLNVSAEHDPGGNCEPFILWGIPDSLSPWGWFFLNIWSKGGVASGDTVDINLTETVYGEALLRLMESDSSSADDLCGSYIYRADDPAPADGLVTINASGGFDGSLTTHFTNYSIPFRGLIDEVQVYKRALVVSDVVNEVEDLYKAGTTAMHLRLDDAPGSTRFRDATGQHDGYATLGSTTPLSGIGGRIQQSVWMDGADDQIRVDDLALSPEYTLAAWVRADQDYWTGVEATIMQFGSGTGAPWMGVQIVETSPGVLTPMAAVSGPGGTVRGGSVPVNTWTHVAYTWDGTWGRVYVNGAAMDSQLISAGTGSGLKLGYADGGAPWLGNLDDVQVYKRALSWEEVQELYESAPQMVLHLDAENYQQDSSGNGYHATCSDACPKPGIDGKLRTATVFATTDAYLQLPSAGTLELEDADWTISAWIKADELRPSGPHIILGNDGADTSGGLNLGVSDGQPYMGGYGLDLTGETELSPGAWYHIAWVYSQESGTGTTLLNGSVVTRTVFSYVWAQGSEPLYLGGTPSGNGFSGAIDEVTMYRRALSARELREIFLYQGAWVQDREVSEITVDADLPSSELLSDTPYRPLAETILAVAAHDSTSSVTGVEWSVNGGAWQSLPQCMDAEDGGHWCPTFVPDQEGAYVIQTRATDVVGHVESPVSTATLYVDNTPPTVASSIAADTVLPAPTHSSHRNRRVVTLRGTATDPALPGGHEGSGVRSLKLTVLDASGLAAGARAQLVTLTDTDTAGQKAWTVEYELDRYDATGGYTLVAEVEDMVGNVTTIDNLLSFQIDSTVPQVVLTQPSSNVATEGALTEDGALITGTIDDTEDANGQPVVSSGVDGVELAFASTTAGTVFSEATPALVLAFDRSWLADGAGLNDVTDRVQATLHTGDDQNHAVTGQVGDFALRLDGEDDYVTVDLYEDLSATSFTIEFWAKTDSPGVVVRHGSLLIGPAENGQYLFSFDGTCSQPMLTALSRDITDLGPSLMQASGVEWVHYAFVYDAEAGQRRIYRRGYSDTVWSATQSDGPTSYSGVAQVTLGDAPAGCDRFAGLVDQVILHKRALTPEELDATDAGWRPVTDLTLAGDGNSATWSYTVPAGLEGLYEIRLRGRDTFDNVSSMEDGGPRWGGPIDTLAPRLSVTREYLGEGDSAKTRYTGYAEDLNLSSDGFQCPCAAEAVKTEYYDAPWYTELFTDTAPRLYRLSYTCEKAGHQFAPLSMGAQDLFGHIAADTRGGLISAGLYDAPAATTALDLAGSYATVAMPNKGLDIVDVSDPSSPAKVGDTYPTYTGSNQTSLACRREEQRCVIHTDITIPTGSSSRGEFVDTVTLTYNVRFPFAGAHSKVTLISPTGHRLLVYEYDYNYSRTQNATVTLTDFAGERVGGTWQLEVDDSWQMCEAVIQGWSISIIPQAKDPQDVKVSGNYAYVADDEGSLRVYDVSTPSAPARIGYYLDNQANDSSGGTYRSVDISSDGRYVAFQSAASNLVPGDTNGVTDIFIYDRQTGTIARVSLATNGTQPERDCTRPSISDNGRFVAFESLSTNLLAVADPYSYDVFLRDRDTDNDGIYDEAGAVSTIRISQNPDGTPPNSNSGQASISNDGNYVAFQSYASNLVATDTNGKGDIFVYNRQTGSIALVSRATDGTQGNGDSQWPSISGNGRYVAFQSAASNLVSDDTNMCGSFPYTNCEDIFVRDRDTDSDSAYDESGAVVTVRASVASDGAQSDGPSYAPSISADGRYVAFSSTATNLVSGDSNGREDVFRRRIWGGDTFNTWRVSNTTGAYSGQPAGGNSFGASISNNGRYVAFRSFATNMVPGDMSGEADVFVYDVDEDTTRFVSCNPDGAPAGGQSTDVSLSNNGEFVAFVSGANLTGGAGGTQIYLNEWSGHTTLVSRVAIPAKAVHVSGQYVYLGTESTVEVINVSAPASPARAGVVQVGTRVEDIILVGSRLYVVGHNGSAQDGLHIYDVTGSGNSVTLTRVAWDTGTNKTYNNVRVVGDRAYVGGKDTTSGESLLVYDVTSPSGAITPIGSGYSTLVNARGLDTASSSVFLGVGQDLHDVNVSTPTSPSKQGDVTTAGTIQDVVSAEPYVHVANGDLEILQRPVEEPILATIFLAPTDGTLLTTLGANEVSGWAYAEGGYLQDLTVTINGVTHYTQSWAGQSLTSATWTAPDWTPTTDGVYHFEVISRDTQGGSLTDTITVIVDSAAPTVSVSTSVFASAHYNEDAGQVHLFGNVADAAGVGNLQVEVTLDGETLPGTTEGGSAASGSWSAYWAVNPNTPPDGSGAARTLTVTVTDLAGNTATATGNITVDVVPPDAVTLALSSGGQALKPGDTVRQASPELTVAWSASQDAGGLASSPYEVTWVDATGATFQTTSHGTGDSSDVYTASELQIVSARVTVSDQYGNSRQQTIGPVHVDAPTTPDLIGMDAVSTVYHGWMESDGSLIGTDRRVKDKSPDNAKLNNEQHLYVTWDAEALRLAWTGADWSTDGDLFIYLDTVAGQGSNQAYNPTVGDQRMIYLPGTTPADVELDAPLKPSQPQIDRQERLTQADDTTPMEADYLIRVQDAETATLLEWTGSAWTTVGQLGKERYRFDGSLNGGQTDLYLPFTLIGASATSSLDLVAFATEEGEMLLWSAMPPENPVTADRAAPTKTQGEPKTQENLVGTFALTQSYHWDSLSSGKTANGKSVSPLVQLSWATVQPLQASSSAVYADTDLRLHITTSPAGSVFSYVQDGLFNQWASLFDPNRPVDLSESFDFMDSEHPRLGDGDEITYLLECTNRGTDAATGVQAELFAYYALRLLDAAGQPADHLVVDLGTVGPGETVQATVTGVIDLSYARGTYYDTCTDDAALCKRYLQWAALDVRFTDDQHTHSPLDWAWVDHWVDPEAPQFYGLQKPTYLLAPGNNLLQGYAYDNSQVRSLSLEITPAGGAAYPVVECTSCLQGGGFWSYAWDLTANGATPEDGDTYEVRVRAEDEFYQEGAWSNAYTLVVDAVPPTVTLDPGVVEAYSGRTLAHAPAKISGTVTDNRGLGSVEVCVNGDCQQAQVTLQPVMPAVHEDGSAAAVGTCPTTTEIQFVITRAFVIGRIQLGLNIDHPYRDDLTVELVSPAGTKVQVIAGEQSVASTFQNLDVLLDDAAPSGLFDARADDNTDMPLYDRFCRPYQPLQTFIGEASEGTWTLRICDTDGSQHDGMYNSSTLVLVPQNTGVRSGTWSYQPSKLEQGNEEEQILSIYAVDSVGNRATTPVELIYRLDRTAPDLVITEVVADIVSMDATPVLAGTVTDGNVITALYVTVEMPDGSSYVSPITTWEGDTWGYSLQPNGEGIYKLWVNTEDEAGNASRVGPVEVSVMAPPLPPEPPVTPTPEPPKVEVSLTTDVDTFCPGAEVRYTFQLRNISDGALTNVIITDVLPAEASSAADGPSSTVSGALSADGTAMVWQVGTVQPGEIVTAELVLTTAEGIPNEGEIGNAFTYSASELAEEGAAWIGVEADHELCTTAVAGGPYETQEGQPITLDGSGSHVCPGGTLTYAWDLDNDGEYDDADTMTVLWDQVTNEGTYQIGLQVTDDLGRSDSDTATITVIDVAPVIEAGEDLMLYEGDLAEVHASFIDSGVEDVHTATIDWGDGAVTDGIVTEATGTGEVTGSHVYVDDGAYTITVTVLTVGGGEGSEGSDTLQVIVEDVVPTIALSGAESVDEGAEYALTLGEITDLGDDTVTVWAVHWGDGKSDTYSAGGNVTHIYADGPNSYTITVDLTDEDGTHVSTGSLSVTVDNVAPVISASSESQTVQYSEVIAGITLAATDVEADTMVATPSWSADGINFDSGLPDYILLDGEPACITDEGIGTCTWNVNGIAGVLAGTYTLRITITDDDGGGTDHDVTLIVEPEEANVTFDEDNPVAVQVASAGGNGGSFMLSVCVSERDITSPGDISRAEVSMSLVPVGPGGPIDPIAMTATGDGVCQWVTFSFNDVPVNTYTVQVTVGGGYYVGYGEDVLVVYDPSLGFTTGGGWFYWPDTADAETGYLGDKTNFGYTMKYNKKGTNVQGNLLLIRHLADGTIYRVKSNALYGLALGEDPKVPMGWASFGGKSTYQEPGWPEPIGNYKFMVYVEDRNEPGTGIDSFWIEVIGGLALSRTDQGNAIPIEIYGGNIVVPHKAK